MTPESTFNSAISQFASMFGLWDWILVVVIWAGLQAIQERFEELFVKPRLGWRLLPFIPVVLCTSICLVPSLWLKEEAPASMRALFGAALGVIAYNFGGIANRIGLVKLLNVMGLKAAVEKTKPPPPQAP